MEYKVTKDNGESVWYKLIGGNVIPSEVSSLDVMKHGAKV